MESKDFFAIGKERKTLRQDILSETGVSARELSKGKKGLMTEEAFASSVAAGRLADVAEKAVVSDPEGTQAKLGRIEALSEEAKAFNRKDRKQRTAYEESRSLDRENGKPAAGETEAKAEQQKIFRELDLMDEFLVGQRRGEYLMAQHPDDPRLPERLRRNATIEEMLMRRRAFLETDPGTRLVVREHELCQYNRELDTDHYVVTESRREYIFRIEALVNQRKPILLEGHTGTGKSELARIAARELTGHDPEVVYCNPQTRVSDIFGRQALKETASGATVTETDYGPLIRAMQAGRICIFDEFNELDPRGRQMLKYLYNARPGEYIDVPGDGKVRVEEGFGLVMTANLKSGKYQAKGELEPQEARVFQDSTIRVDYPPAHELYDTALSALSDTEGRVMLTREEAETTLKGFIDAIADIEEAYAKSLPARYGQDKDLPIGTRKKRPALEKYVLDTGMAVRLLQGFHIDRMKYGTPLREFIDQSLLRTFEGDRVSEDDKRLAIFILAKHGFCQDKAALREIGIDYTGNQTLDPGGFPKISEPALDPKESLRTLSAEDVARLDPYGRRKASVADAFEEFDIAAPDAVANQEQKEECTLAEAETIMGREHLLGPADIEQVFGVKPDQVPPIPFAKRELMRAKELEQQLILCVDTLDLNGRVAPLTLANLKQKFGEAHDGGKMWYTQDWYKNEDFFHNEKPRLGWRLTSENVIPGSTSKNYLEQTREIVKYLKEDVFQNQPLPPAYAAAVAEFKQEETTLEALMQSDWQAAGRRLAGLSITKYMRESPVEAMYRLILSDQARQVKPLAAAYTWTNSASSGGSLVSVGSFVADGSLVRSLQPGNRRGRIGVSFSRSA